MAGKAVFPGQSNREQRLSQVPAFDLAKLVQWGST
jgi:hypothetical protein